MIAFIVVVVIYIIIEVYLYDRYGAPLLTLFFMFSLRMMLYTFLVIVIVSCLMILLKNFSVLSYDRFASDNPFVACAKMIEYYIA